MIFKNFRLPLWLLVCTLLLAACKKDKDDKPVNETTPVSSVLTFESFSDEEFRMWTNGAEISTAGMSISDYMDAELYTLLSDSTLKTITINVTSDSLHVSQQDSVISYSYTIVNDSIYAVIPFVFGEDTVQYSMFFGTGSPYHIEMTQAYTYCHIEGGAFATVVSSYNTTAYTFESAAVEIGIEDYVSDIGPEDTLLIYNRQAIYN